MGTHPIFESDFDCLTDLLVKRITETVELSPDNPIGSLSNRLSQNQRKKTVKPSNELVTQAVQAVEPEEEMPNPNEDEKKLLKKVFGKKLIGKNASKKKISV